MNKAALDNSFIAISIISIITKIIILGYLLSVMANFLPANFKIELSFLQGVIISSIYCVLSFAFNALSGFCFKQKKQKDTYSSISTIEEVREALNAVNKLHDQKCITESEYGQILKVIDQKVKYLESKSE